MPIRTRVGHSFIKQVMAETGAVFGGEHSGHYYFREHYNADSGLVATMVVVDQMSKAGQPLSELLRPFRRYHDSGEINSVVEDKAGTIQRVAAAHADGREDWLDGLTVEYDDWWFNVRASNTEPLLRLNVEARDEALLAEKTERLLGSHPGARPTGLTRGGTSCPSTRSCWTFWCVRTTAGSSTTCRTRTCSCAGQCRYRYSVRDDIPNMLIEDAEKPGS